LRHREKIFWLIVGFALILGVISLIPAHYEICKEGAKASEESCPSYRVVPLLVIEVGKILDALSVAITALATIAIAWFTWSLRRSTDKLWDAGEAQRALSEQTAERQLRAYVFVFNGVAGRDVDGRIKVDITLRNSGQTPAYDLVHRTAVRLVPDEAASGYSEEGITNQKIIIAPTSGVPMTLFSRREFGLDELERYAASELRIVVFGAAVYRDAFDKVRTTNFRFEVEHDVWMNKGRLRPTEEGNDAT
jgi:hypothetical protein